MSLDKLQKLVGSLVKTAEGNEQLALPILVAKTNQYLEVYPEDQTIGAMNNVLGKMVDNKTFFIRRADFKNLYQKLYSRNTKFAEIFSDELKTVEVSAPVAMNHDEGGAIETYVGADSVLANALSAVFDGGSLKMYSAKVADKAKVSVGSTLDAWNLTPSKLEVNAGNDKFLVIKADYETPKGVTSLYVPVETNGEKVVEATVFMGNSGPQTLNHLNIKKYLTTFAGLKNALTGEGILNVLNLATAESREISDAEIALTKLNASRQSKSDFTGGILGQKMASAAVKDVELPKSDEFASFEDAFSNPYGVASFTFGVDKVVTARDSINRELIGFGYKKAQVTVTGSDENTVFYGVSLDGGKVAFTVPVKIAAGKIAAPRVILCSGSVGMFSAAGINQLYVNNQSDFKVAAAASPLFGLKPSDLINNIRAGIAEGNHDKAEDALNVLANMGDEKAYAIGFNEFLSGLGGKTVKAEVVTCDMVIKSASSEHPICGHTGLPLHKVYTDKQGNCRPEYRRGMDESYQGACFNNSKIFG